MREAGRLGFSAIGASVAVIGSSRLRILLSWVPHRPRAGGIRFRTIPRSVEFGSFNGKPKATAFCARLPHIRLRLAVKRWDNPGRVRYIRGTQRNPASSRLAARPPPKAAVGRRGGKRLARDRASLVPKPGSTGTGPIVPKVGWHGKCSGAWRLGSPRGVGVAVMDASFEEVVNEVLLAKETAGKFAQETGAVLATPSVKTAGLAASCYCMRLIFNQYHIQ